MDDQIVLTCDGAKFDLVKGLSRTVQSEVKPMITQCCMQALYATNNQSAISLAKEFERRRCNHPPTDPKPPHECIKSIVDINGDNKHRYVVAADNEKLRYSLRRIPGVPLIYMNRSVMVMEPLSKSSAKVSNLKEASKLTGGLNSIRSGAVGGEEEWPNSAKKRRVKKEPNPLSILKKKKKAPSEAKPEQNKTDKKKRRRTRKKGADDDDDKTEGKSEEEKEEAHSADNDSE